MINIATKEDFWHEVRLLALNNYGSWSSDPMEVRAIVETAVSDALDNLKDNLFEKEEFNKIVDEMLEANND